MTTNWELVKDDDEQFQYTLNKNSNQKESTQMEANKKGIKVKPMQKPAHSKLQPNGKKQVRTKLYNMNEIALLLTSSVKQNR